MVEKARPVRVLSDPCDSVLLQCGPIVTVPVMNIDHRPIKELQAALKVPSVVANPSIREEVVAQVCWRLLTFCCTDPPALVKAYAAPRRHVNIDEGSAARAFDGTLADPDVLGDLGYVFLHSCQPCLF